MAAELNGEFKDFMFTHKLLNPLSKLFKARYGGFHVVHSQTSTAPRSDELSLSGTQILFYFGIVLATTGLLTWAVVRYMVFAL